MNRRYTEFSQLKTTQGKPPANRGAGSRAGMPMKTASWPAPGPAGRSGFNKTTKVKALKNTPVRQGLH